MRILLVGLIGLICMYHIILTGISTSWPDMRVYLPLIRDLLRIVAVMRVSISARHRYGFKKIVWPILKHLWPALLGSIFFVGRAMAYTYSLSGTGQQMLIGIKYDIRFFILGILAVVGGWRWALLHSDDTEKSISIVDRYTSYAWRGIGTIIILGYVRQIAKVLFPDVFMSFGYGPVGDYAYGEHPPIWYRTGPGGAMRRSGLFSGPNNYGFFLVACFGFFITKAKSATELLKEWYTEHQRKIVIWVLISLYVTTVLLSFSRGALMGCVAQILILVRKAKEYLEEQSRGYEHIIRQRVVKKIKLIIMIGSIIAVVAVGIISVLKWGSTVEHILRTKEGIDLVIAQPWGYGLGSAGPAIHRGGIYLPENMYIQILLDSGRIGLISWLVVWTWRFVRGSRLARVYHLRALLGLRAGFVGVSIEGLFLHVWEDSMVNMIFFGLFGMIVGVLGQAYSVQKAQEKNQSVQKNLA